MDVLEIKRRADGELELMQGCLPAIDNLPTEVEDLIEKLLELSIILHSTGNRLAGYAGYLRKEQNKKEV